MIGGYIYRRLDPDLDARLRERIRHLDNRIDAWDSGYLFHEQRFRDQPAARHIADDLIAVSEDLLVAANPEGEYSQFNLSSEFAARLAENEAAAFDAIASDYRMAVVQRRDGETRLLLASNRAGSGRVYYHVADDGVVFSSDLRFLLQIVPCEVSALGIHAILKFGAVPEPLTISETIRAVPVAHFLGYEPGTGAHRTLPYFQLKFPCERTRVDDDDFLGASRDALRSSARYLGARSPAILLSGGIDSSLYGCYLSEAGAGTLKGFYCEFGEADPELAYARQIGERVGADLHVARMETKDALRVLGDVVRLTDHPFSDFSSLPITFTLQQVKERTGEGATLIECNGGDDCFGFPDLTTEAKFALKHRFPGILKRPVAALLGRTPYWKWSTHEGTPARLAALADTHEQSALDYFMVLAPMAYLGLSGARERDASLAATMEDLFSQCGENYDTLSYEAKTTIRQLMHVNSRRWAAKALSVGESLGIRVVYPFLWREVLEEQGRIPWDAKVRNGVVKWPLKRLLEDYMPESFIYRPKSGFVPPSTLR